MFPSKKVPTGIKIICVLELIVLLPIVAGLMEYLGETGLALSDVGVLGAIAITIVGLRLLGVLGLLTMQSWGYKIAMGMYGLALFFGFTLLFVEPASGIAALLVYGVLAIYVHSKKRLYVPVKPGASI